MHRAFPVERLETFYRERRALSRKSSRGGKRNFPAAAGTYCWREVRKTDIMDDYRRDGALPEGLREALGKNGKALQYWSAMTAQQRQQAVEEVRALQGPREIEEYVNELVGWQKGHDPREL